MINDPAWFFSCIYFGGLTDEPTVELQRNKSLAGDMFMCLYNDLGIFIAFIPELVLGNILAKVFMSIHASENLSVRLN